MAKQYEINSEEFVAAPNSVNEMYNHLNKIKEACKHLEDLKNKQILITQREVLKLRKAFWLTTGKTEKLRDGKITSALYGEEVFKHNSNDSEVTACDRVFRELEDYVITRPEANTFDLENNNNNNNNNIGWHFFNIPFERRMQTLAISLPLFFIYIPFCIFLTFMLLINLFTMPFMLIYIIYIFTIGRPKHPLKKNFKFIRFRLWKYASDYFPIRLIIPNSVKEKFDSSKNYFFIYHPHGINSFGAILTFMLDALHITSIFPDLTIHMQTLNISFSIPFWREWVLLTGSGDASSDCIHRTLRAGPGESVLLVVGGVRESLLAKPNTNELILQKRKGFVRIALQEGSPLVPVYAFGENDVYRIPRMAHSDWWKKLEKFLRKVTTFAIPLFVGRGWFNYCFGVLPHRRPIVVVVGEPMPVPKIVNPTPQEIQEWHDKYVLALQKLFNEHRGVYDVESSGLRIH